MLQILGGRVFAGRCCSSSLCYTMEHTCVFVLSGSLGVIRVIHHDSELQAHQLPPTLPQDMSSKASVALAKTSLACSGAKGVARAGSRVANIQGPSASAQALEATSPAKRLQFFQRTVWHFSLGSSQPTSFFGPNKLRKKDRPPWPFLLSRTASQSRNVAQDGYGEVRRRAPWDWYMPITWGGAK